MLLFVLFIAAPLALLVSWKRDIEWLGTIAIFPLFVVSLPIGLHYLTRLLDAL